MEQRHGQTPKQTDRQTDRQTNYRTASARVTCVMVAHTQHARARIINTSGQGAKWYFEQLLNIYLVNILNTFGRVMDGHVIIPELRLKKDNRHVK